MKRVGTILSFLLLGLFSFVFFLYFTFPYEVLKEALAIKASEASGLGIEIGDLGPSFPLGFDAENVKVTSPGGSAFAVREADFSISILNLLIGKLALDIELIDDKDGTLDIEAKFGLLSLALGRASLPSSLYVEAHKFLFGKIIDFALNKEAQDPEVNVMVKPWLESVDIDGRLNALIDLSINESDLTKSEGEATISLVDTVVKSLNSNLPIPDQHFSQAVIKATLNNGILAIDKSSKIVSQDLSVSLNGKVTQKPDLMKSQLDIDIGIEMGEPLKEQFGIVLYAITNRDTQGKLQIKISGALTPQPSINIL